MTAKEIIKLAIFEGKQIRKIIHDGEWWFSVVDVVAVLSESPTPRQYWGKVKKREFIDLQLSLVWVQLKLEADDGKKYATDCSNTKGLFRIIQSIPSPKAEPFKQWLAQVGYERIQEIENPELAQERMKLLYELKGLTRKNENLRDHMTDLELIFTMLGEKVTTEISQTEKPDTFEKNKKVARRGGGVAGIARKETEKELGRSIVSKKNYLPKEIPDDNGK